MSYVDSFGVKKIHLPHRESMLGYQRVGMIEVYKILAVEYVQKMIDDMNAHFYCLPTLSVTKLFSPKHYPLDEIERNHLTEQLPQGIYG
jgi:hypothetical protein